MFVKGKSGNPNGRPKTGFPLSDILRNSLQSISSDGTGRTMAQVITDRLMHIATTSEDIQALTGIKQIMDRIEGTPHQSISQNINASVEMVSIGKPDFVEDET